MSSQKLRQLSTPAIAAIAVLLGAIVGAWWVYGTNNGSGNGNQAESEQLALASADKKCAAKDGLAQNLKPLVRGDIAAMAIRQPVTSAPLLSFNDPSGATSNVADFSGQSLLINIWATWCAPCRAEMPGLSQLQTELGGDDFKVLAINIDTGDQTKPLAFMEEIGVSNLGLYQDNTMEAFNMLKREGLALGLPATLLVDAEGCLFGVMNGPAEWAGDDGKALVSKLIELSDRKTSASESTY